MATEKTLLFIADFLSSLKIASDSSLAIAKAALIGGLKVLWCTPEDLHFTGKGLSVSSPSRILAINFEAERVHTETHPTIDFASIDFCMIRKDPPFDEQYKDLCWLLTTQKDTQIINPAEALLSFHEKTLHWRAYSEQLLNDEEVIPTCISSSYDIIVDFCSKYTEEAQTGFVCKPWLGHGGAGVEAFSDIHSLLHSLRQRPLVEKVIIQPLLPEIYTEGDRRVLIANGDVVADFVRFPPAGGIAANLSQGGYAVLQAMSPAQKDLCYRLGQFLKKRGILFAGVDLIGQRVGEINITSPTGIRMWERLSGDSTLSHKILNLLTQ